MTNWNGFDHKTAADEVVAGVDLSGKLMIVTGANTGIGFEAARALCARVGPFARDSERFVIRVLIGGTEKPR